MSICISGVLSHQAFLGKYNKYKKLIVQCTSHGQGASDSVKTVQFVREKQWQ